MINCSQCGRPLSGMEIGLSKKLVNRSTRFFYCLTCLSIQFQVTECQLKEMAEDFRKAGCTLFR